MKPALIVSLLVLVGVDLTIADETLSEKVVREYEARLQLSDKALSELFEEMSHEEKDRRDVALEMAKKLGGQQMDQLVRMMRKTDDPEVTIVADELERLLPLVPFYESGAIEILRRAIKGDAYAEGVAANMFYLGECGLPRNLNESLRLAKLSADKKHAMGHYGLGCLYDDEEGPPKNMEYAIECFSNSATGLQKLAEEGDVRAQCNLGFLYESGYAWSIDYDRAMASYAASAAGGYPRAMFRIGRLHEKGLGVETNDAEAVKWFRKGAEAGDLQCLHSLAWKYGHGEGVASNPVAAVALLKESAKRGYHQSIYSVGWCYYQGFGIEQDYEEAFYCFSRAAEQDYAVAFFLLGLMYDTRRGVERDVHKAIEWYGKAASQGSASGAFNLALIYQFGKGVPEDHATAVKYYRMAAERGHVDALHSLGCHYEKGDGIEQDYGEAFKWYSKAIEAGGTASLGNIGGLYFEGNGVEQDYDMAAEWYQKAAKAGNRNAIYGIAEAYKKAGQYEKAFDFYRLGVEMGCHFCMNTLGVMCLLGEEIKPEPAKAFEVFIRADELGNDLAPLNLAELYAIGKGAGQDLEKARAYAERAIARGHADDANRLFAAIRQLEKAEDVGRGYLWERTLAQNHITTNAQDIAEYLDTVSRYASKPEALVQNLAHEDVEQRDAAQQRLGMLGAIAKDIVQEATASDNPVRQERAKRILAELSDDALEAVLHSVLRCLWQNDHAETTELITGFASLFDTDDLQQTAGWTLEQCARQEDVSILKRAGQTGASWLRQSAEKSLAKLKGDPETDARASMLEDGHVLVTRRNKNEVVELDESGEVVWRHEVGDPRRAEKLPNGNVLIAAYGEERALEVTPGGEIAWEYKGLPCYSVKQLPSGNVLIATYWDRRVVEIDKTTEKIVWEYLTAFNCRDAQLLENGNILVCTEGLIREVTRNKQTVWKFMDGCSFHSVQRLKNGNTLFASRNQHKAVEIDRNGKVVWQHEAPSTSDAYRLPSGNTLITAKDRIVEVTPKGRIVWSTGGCNYGTCRK